MKISIITVSYNSAETIKDTLESVYNQTYDKIEYILIDGKSNDTTLQILESYESDFAKKGIEYKWISEKDNGIYEAINKGIQLSTGDVIGILNSDDYYNDNDVVKDIATVFNQNDIDCIYGNLKYIDPLNKKVTRKWVSRDFEFGLFEKSWTPAHPTFYCKKESYIKHGLYRTDFKIAADVELMYRFLEKDRINSKFLNRPMVVMRQGGVSSSGLKSTYIITKEMRKAFKDNGGNFNLLKYLGYKILKVKEFIKI
ncbi:glycosyltransferase family 2 protein [Virgibacillus litoralis]|uniref:Glycosyltransferase involved in cell wall biosynthesis n=1 Tax=Virgibacillus litoralis TaxID=578221 RepID=A0ABS4HI62_9BACI|nr:glycosyltransferase family 2 protein [Virgibacillus litoralis]MBP1950568.1 glycosyltransferase involved in cell wall biosynthesis [Virgibacillus litoralis]